MTRCYCAHGDTRNEITSVRLGWNVYTGLTQLYDGRDMYRIYYIENNYMFRHFSLAIFTLINEKNLVSSYTRLVWVVYSGEVRGEVGTRSGMCYVGWLLWVHGGSAVFAILG